MSTLGSKGTAVAIGAFLSLVLLAAAIFLTSRTKERGGEQPSLGDRSLQERPLEDHPASAPPLEGSAVRSGSISIGADGAALLEIRSAVDQRPIPGASLLRIETGARESSEVLSIADAQGAITIGSEHLASTLHVAARGFRSKPVADPRPGERRVVLMDRGARLEVRCVDAHGGAVESVSVVASRASVAVDAWAGSSSAGTFGVASARAIHRGRTDSSGLAALEGMEDGDYFVYVAHPELFPIDLDMDSPRRVVGEGERLQVTMQEVHAVAARFELAGQAALLTSSWNYGQRGISQSHHRSSERSFSNIHAELKRRFPEATLVAAAFVEPRRLDAAGRFQLNVKVIAEDFAAASVKVPMRPLSQVDQCEVISVQQEPTCRSGWARIVLRSADGAREFDRGFIASPVFEPAGAMISLAIRSGARVRLPSGPCQVTPILASDKFYVPSMNVEVPADQDIDRVIEIPNDVRAMQLRFRSGGELIQGEGDLSFFGPRRSFEAKVRADELSFLLETGEWKVRWRLEGHVEGSADFVVREGGDNDLTLDLVPVD